MIYAKTGMEKLPEACMACDMLCEDAIKCTLSGVYVRRTGRHRACPLTEINETLPAQLAAKPTDTKGD